MIADHETESLAVARSFRDPAGSLFIHQGRVLRCLNADGAADLDAFLETRTARAATDSGSLVRSRPVDWSDFPELARTNRSLIEHERIPFPSYPYEWPPEMLYAAGAATLDLALNALEEGFGLKDATPYNVLFRGSRPVFVDVLSFERRDPLDSAWMPYGQFVRTFLLPLLANRRFGLPLSGIFSGSRDGLEPEEIYRWASPLTRLTPQLLSLVSLPAWLKGKTKDDSAYHPRHAASPEQARFILKGILRSCQRHLRALAPSAERESVWTDYLDHKSLYTAETLAQKEAFVSEALALARPASVLDVGANEGHFSLLAAKQGASVIAIDSDPGVVGRMYQNALREKLDVLPLIVDLTRPTPAIGWRNQECASFLDRARGHFDMVMMLAVIHHILVTERIPLDELLALTAELTREYTLIEFVAFEDPMLQRILRGRGDLYSHLTREHFEAAAAKKFDTVRSLRIGGLHRWLYLFRLRQLRS